MTVTKFWDMHSGGSQKLGWDKIYIEAPEDEAIRVFYSRFGRNPYRVTCTCCGEDYSISEHADLEEASVYHRTYKKKKVLSVSEYLEDGSALFIGAETISRNERNGPEPEPEGYVWV